MATSDYSVVRRIKKLALQLDRVSDEELRRRSLSLKYEASTGAKIESLIPRAFALVTQSLQRTLKMTPYHCQVLGGIQLAKCRIAEMKTGEGKTLTASFPTYVHALYGQGAHVVTVNDYLARRDYEIMGAVYRRLGLSSGVIQQDSQPEAREHAYAQDITYGTSKQFGFDFLRDRMKMADGQQTGSKVMRDLHFVLVDEADSVLIDEARTPLIIGLIDQSDHAIAESCYRWAADHVTPFEEGPDYKYDHDKRKVELKPAGMNRLRSLPQNDATRSISFIRLREYMENAIKVRRDFTLDKNYAVIDGKIVIIDEFTGRPAEGRQWQGGIHQSVEAKEKIEVTPATKQGAMITVQTFFKRYKKFAGMSGTVWTSRKEFRKVYKSKVVRIPTNRPIIRKQLPTQILPDIETKFEAVAKEAVKMIDAGRAVLIGTRSVEKSELLSKALTARGINHNILNAKYLDQEAQIVEACGAPGRVTVATNMAGRGTDIVLDESVRSAGGLHVIITEIHESQRIDWQLIGRGCRQGDPGSFRIFVSMDDEILRLGLGPHKSNALLKKYRKGRISRDVFKVFRLAQAKLEHRYLVDRMILMKQDIERQERHYEMGQDPFRDVVQS